MAKALQTVQSGGLVHLEPDNAGTMLCGYELFDESRPGFNRGGEVSPLPPICAACITVAGVQPFAPITGLGAVEVLDAIGRRAQEGLADWLREAADELEGAHAILDEQGVPRMNPSTGNPLTLAARIATRGEVA